MKKYLDNISRLSGGFRKYGATLIKSKKLGRPITQKHCMGCGIACVSYIAKKTYDKVLEKYPTKNHAWTRGFYCKDLVKLLAMEGYYYKWRKVKKDESISEIPLKSIVFIARSDEYPVGHFMVKESKNKYMNPWINHPEMSPAKSGFQKEIGSISYVVEPV